MLKGQVFARQLFENQIFALFIDTFLNGVNGVSDNYKNGMAVTYSGSNVTIASGAVCVQGRFLEEDTSTTLSAGTDSMYCKLVIEIDLDKTNTESDFEQGYYKIVKSASDYPALTQTNIVKNNAGIYQYELARFQTSSNGISNFEDKRTFLDFDSIYAEINAHIQAIDDGSAFVYKNQISILTGSVELAGNATVNTNISYPTGFEYSNCVPISCGIKENETRGYNFVGDYKDTVDLALAAVHRRLNLNSTDILLSIDNPASSTKTYSYKIVLMKVS